MEPQDTEKKMGSKKPRKRMKAIYAQIKKLMEFYFSDSNLYRGRFLKQIIEQSPDGYVDLSVFLTFNRIKAITDSVKVIAAALTAGPSTLQVNEEETKVRRVTPIAEPVNVDERTVYVECLPSAVDHDWMRKVFSSCGEVTYISLPKYQSTKDLKGFGFVEFETEEAAAKACQELNNPPAGMSNKPGIFPKSNHELDALWKKLPPDQILDSDEEEEDKKEESGSPEDKDSKDIEVRMPDTSKRSRRRQAQSDSSIEAGVSESPTKRKKSEVSFELAEETEKTPGSGKKRSKKRKQRSKASEAEPAANSEESSAKTKSEDGSSDTLIKDSPNAKRRKVESNKQGDLAENSVPQKGSSKKRPLESPVKGKLSDNSSDASAAESPGVKRRKVDSDKAEDSLAAKKDSQSKKGGSSKIKGDKSDQQDTQGQSSKKAKRKRKKNHKPEIPELRVIPKSEWLKLKQEYLKLQKESMAKLKKILKKTKPAANGEEACVDKAQGSKKMAKEIEYVPDVIVKVVSEKPLVRKNFKGRIPDSVSVAYLDFKDGLLEGHIRCQSPDSAKTLLQQNLEGCQLISLTGEEEKAYWDKLKLDREAKYSKASKDKTRGQQKLIDKAQTKSLENMKVTRTHIVF